MPNPKTPEHRAAIAASVRRTATYRRDFHDFFQLCYADMPDEAERRLAQIRIARRLVVAAPEDDRQRWRHFLDALERGMEIRVKTYQLDRPRRS